MTSAALQMQNMLIIASARVFWDGLVFSKFWK